MIRRPPRSTRTDTLFPTRRSSDLPAPAVYAAAPEPSREIRTASLSPVYAAPIYSAPTSSAPTSSAPTSSAPAASAPDSAGGPGIQVGAFSSPGQARAAAASARVQAGGLLGPIGRAHV